MEVKEILENLYKCKEACEKSEFIETEVAKKENPILELSNKIANTKMIKSIILFTIVGAVISLILDSYSQLSAIAFLSGPFAGVVVHLIKKSSMKNELASLQSEFESFKEQKQGAVQAIVEEYAEYLKILPVDYWYLMAVNHIIKYFEQGRVQNMSEALKLYDDQLHQWTMEQQNQQILQAQNEQMRMARATNIIAGAALGASLFGRRD